MSIFIILILNSIIIVSYKTLNVTSDDNNIGWCFLFSRLSAQYRKLMLVNTCILLMKSIDFLIIMGKYVFR